MKLKILLICYFGMLSAVLSTRVGSKQLFDMVSKEIENTKPTAKSSSSIFENVAPHKDTKSNLFDSLNFNQVSEKKVVKKEAKSLFGSVSTAQNQNSASTEKVQNKKIIKVGSKPTMKPNQTYNDLEHKNEAELKDLKKKVNSLLEMNSKLLRRLKVQNRENSKKKKFKRNVVSFIQKYDKDVNNLKQNIESSKNLVEDKLTAKDQEFKKLYESTSKNFEELQDEVQNVHHKLNQLQVKEKKHIDKLRSNLVLKDLSIDKKLEVDGIAFLNKVNAQSIDLGNIKLDSNGLTFKNDNTKLILGNEVFTIGQLVTNMSNFKKLIEKCGENFENCKPVSQEIFRDQAAKQEAILESLKRLRADTTEVLTRHKKFR